MPNLLSYNCNRDPAKCVVIYKDEHFQPGLKTVKSFRNLLSLISKIIFKIYVWQGDHRRPHIPSNFFTSIQTLAINLVNLRLHLLSENVYLH